MEAVGSIAIGVVVLVVSFVLWHRYGMGVAHRRFLRRREKDVLGRRVPPPDQPPGLHRRSPGFHGGPDLDP